MATPQDEFAAHCVELLQSLGPVHAKRLFGGHGLHLGDLMVGLIFGEQLYLKTDAQSQPAWQAAGGRAFVYTSRREDRVRAVTMSYWTPPAEAIDSPALMAPWARLALEAALRVRATKPAPRRRLPKPAKAGRKRSV